MGDLMGKKKETGALCPYCGHKWTYKEKLFGYMIKPRSRTRCPNCKTYIEPSTKSITYEYIALVLLIIGIIFIVPNLPVLNSTRVFIVLILFGIYIFLFVPLSLQFEIINYNIKDKDNEGRN